MSRAEVRHRAKRPRWDPMPLCSGCVGRVERHMPIADVGFDMSLAVDCKVVRRAQSVETADVRLAVLAGELLVPPDGSRGARVDLDKLGSAGVLDRRQTEGDRHNCTDNHRSNSCYAAGVLRRSQDQEACQTGKPLRGRYLAIAAKKGRWRVVP